MLVPANSGLTPAQLQELAASAVLEITAELDAGRALADVPLDAAIRDPIAEIVLSNDRLQERLVTAEAELERQAREIAAQAAVARTDALTGLCNRRGFDDEFNRRLAEWVRRKSVFSLLMIDVDGFKGFNDLHGHQGGDEVLREVAGLLIRTFRDMDLVARYGGEEFAVILPATFLNDAISAAERARRTIAGTSFSLGGNQLRLTVSIGVAQSLPIGAADLIARADEALYAAKADGRNCVFFQDGHSCRAAKDGEITAPCGSASMN
jgi:diguanylate cyclase